MSLSTENYTIMAASCVVSLYLNVFCVFCAPCRSVPGDLQFFNATVYLLHRFLKLLPAVSPMRRKMQLHGLRVQPHFCESISASLHFNAIQIVVVFPSGAFGWRAALQQAEPTAAFIATQMCVTDLQWACVCRESWGGTALHLSSCS